MTAGSTCQCGLFRMGIQSARVTSEVSEMSKFPPFFPPPDCLPIRCWVQNGGPFGYLPNTFPSRIIIVCGIRVAETPARKSIDTHYEQPTSPLRPTAKRSGRRGLFLSAIFRAPRKGHIRGEGGAEMAGRWLRCGRAPLLRDGVGMAQHQRRHRGSRRGPRLSSPSRRR